MHTRLTRATAAIIRADGGHAPNGQQGAAMIVGTAPPTNPARLRDRPVPL